jgi:hypothetical protein
LRRRIASDFNKAIAFCNAPTRANARRGFRYINVPFCNHQTCPITRLGSPVRLHHRLGHTRRRKVPSEARAVRARQRFLETLMNSLTRRSDHFSEMLLQQLNLIASLVVHATESSGSPENAVSSTRIGCGSLSTEMVRLRVRTAEYGRIGCVG